MYRPNAAKRRLQAGEKILGCWSALGSPAVVELLGFAGFDYILLDQEHGIGEPSNLLAQLQAMSATACTSIVRVPWNDHVYLKRVLDAGVEGVMVPSIETAEEARAAVAACRYPPVGHRGAGASSARASNYGMAPDYVATCADNLLIALQIESAKGVENIDSILAVEGIDVMFIGPHDLSGTIGQLGNLKHPDVAALIARAEERILARGLPMGTVPHPGCSALDMFARGYSFVNAGSDVSRLRDSSLSDVRAFRQSFRAKDVAA
ncbi:HpcH/HpaI aldolase family protein [Limobrevibacterium gyesilva]|uniref:Aldolase/citrate lyase family protein n=1 Tax=Limobrevibacterium gyesilva TaxID=2991712 RepID=A0AA41YR34_9PROT|nr:aldolase/citrate lyase family protein [Limobrevibacterium gyesilva]MCW3477300.1 aldolase/citrate lyase family protein [Limobrevibacterium gyesilva]